MVMRVGFGPIFLTVQKNGHLPTTIIFLKMIFCLNTIVQKNNMKKMPSFLKGKLGTRFKG